MKIINDTREQLPYDFQSIGVDPPPITIRKTLESGDYSLEGYETRIAIERKSKADAYGTFGKGRNRFERELERLSHYEFAAVVIESEWLDLIRHPPARSRLNPKTIFVSVIAWCQRFDVHFFTVPNRAFAEKLTYRLLERFWRDHHARL